MASQGQTSSHSSIVDWLEQAHARQLSLCAQLEKIADTLPGPIEAFHFSGVLPNLRTIIVRHRLALEQVLFPMLTECKNTESSTDQLLSQISANNAVDELLAHDTADQLEIAAQTGWPENPDMLAYMLSGLFEGRRRQIAWESLILMPLMNSHLHEGDGQPPGDSS